MKCILHPGIAQEFTDLANNAKALYPQNAKVNNQNTDPPKRSDYKASEQWNLADDKVDIDCGNKESTGKESHVTKTKNESSTIGAQFAPKASGEGGGAELGSISGSRTRGKSQTKLDKHQKLSEQHFGVNRELSSKSRAKSTSEVVTETHSCEVKGIRVSVHCFKTCDKHNIIENFMLKFKVDGEEQEISKNKKPIKQYFKDFQDNEVVTFDGTYTWERKTHKTVHE